MSRPGGRTVAIVRTSTANLASVVTAFERLGCSARTTASADVVAKSDHVVLPGVGAFAAARAAIDRGGLEDALRERMLRGRPTLGICLGMQLMAQGSEESPGVAGFGVLRGIVESYGEGRPELRVPQMGWNLVSPAGGCRVVPEGFAYFANSYRLVSVTDGWLPVWCDYGGRFLAAVERGPVVACQFHPELSGAYGKSLLARWLAA